MISRELLQNMLLLQATDKFDFVMFDSNKFTRGGCIAGYCAFDDFICEANLRWGVMPEMQWFGFDDDDHNSWIILISRVFSIFEITKPGFQRRVPDFVDNRLVLCDRSSSSERGPARWWRIVVGDINVRVILEFLRLPTLDVCDVVVCQMVNGNGAHRAWVEETICIAWGKHWGLHWLDYALRDTISVMWKVAISLTLKMSSFSCGVASVLDFAAYGSIVIVLGCYFERDLQLRLSLEYMYAPVNRCCHKTPNPKSKNG